MIPINIPPIYLERPIESLLVEQGSSGFGDLAKELAGILKQTIEHYQNSVSSETVEQRFRSLALTWQKNTAFSSSAMDILSDSSYLEIIGMGRKALPYIFESMMNTPNHWFIALQSITGLNPVPEAHRGNVTEMTADWLEWGKQNGYSH